MGFAEDILDKQGGSGGFADEVLGTFQEPTPTPSIMDKFGQSVEVWKDTPVFGPVTPRQITTAGQYAYDKGPKAITDAGSSLYKGLYEDFAGLQPGQVGLDVKAQQKAWQDYFTPKNVMTDIKRGVVSASQPGLSPITQQYGVYKPALAAGQTAIDAAAPVIEPFQRLFEHAPAGLVTGLQEGRGVIGAAKKAVRPFTKVKLEPSKYDFASGKGIKDYRVETGERPSLGDMFRNESLRQRERLGMEPRLSAGEEFFASLGGLATRFAMPDIEAGVKKVVGKSVKASVNTLKTVAKGGIDELVKAVNEVKFRFSDYPKIKARWVRKYSPRVGEKVASDAFDDLVKAARENPTQQVTPDWALQQLYAKQVQRPAVVSTHKPGQVTNLREVSNVAVKKPAIPKVVPKPTDAKVISKISKTVDMKGSIKRIPGGIEPSVVQVVNESGKKEFKVIPKGQLQTFHDAIDDTQKGIAGKPMGKDKDVYHLSAATPEKMSKAGFEYTGVANVKDIPSTGKVLPTGIPEAAPHAIEAPEVVRMARQLLGDEVGLKKLRKAYGRFRHGGGKKAIELDPGIFKNPDFAQAVLAHEVGHLADWLPEGNIRRGNIIGRVKKLTRFMGQTLEKLVDADLKEELKNVTQYWNPFEEVEGSRYTKYRYSSPELVADAFSVMINRPEKFAELAPKFKEAFEANLDKNPALKKELTKLHEFLNLTPKGKFEVRQEDVKAGFAKGEEEFKEKREGQEEVFKHSPYDEFKRSFIDKNAEVIKKVKQRIAKGELNPDDNPELALNEYNYVAGKLKNILEDVEKEVRVPASEAGLTDVNFGEYLMARRIIMERRSIANPYGHNPKTARDYLKGLRDQLGPRKYKALVKYAHAFKRIVDEIMAEAIMEGLYKPKQVAQIIKNPAYATFQVLDHVNQYVTPSVIHQEGTLKPIANPFTSTIMKIMSVKRAIERNKTRKILVKFMLKNFPDEIQKARIRRFGKYRAEVVKKEGWGVIPVYDGGKYKAFYVDPYIADTVNKSSSQHTNFVLKSLNWAFSPIKKGHAKLFRPLYINLNLGFQTVNLIRDFWRGWKLNPHVSLGTFIKSYFKYAPTAASRIWGKDPDKIIREMREGGILGITYNQMFSYPEDADTQVEYMLAKQHIINPSKPKGFFKKFMTLITDLGDFAETLPKVVGYMTRKDKNMPLKQVAHEVRTYAGSPDFWRRGSLYGYYNNLLLFSNAIKEGFRGDLEGAFKNPKTRSGYWMKTISSNLLPKIIMALAAAGVFGKTIADNYKKQSEYDKTNYYTFPLGFSKNRRYAVYLRIPQDESGRVIGGLMWNMLNSGKKGFVQTVQDIAAFTGGQVPSPSPMINLAEATIQFLTGKNPYDPHYGKTIMTQDEMEAGGLYKIKPFLKYAGGKVGLYKLDAQYSKGELKWWQGIAVNTPVLARYIRVSKAGEYQTQRRRQKPMRKALARIKVIKRGLFKKAIR